MTDELDALLRQGRTRFEGDPTTLAHRMASAQTTPARRARGGRIAIGALTAAILAGGAAGAAASVATNWPGRYPDAIITFTDDAGQACEFAAKISPDGVDFDDPVVRAAREIAAEFVAYAESTSIEQIAKDYDIPTDEYIGYFEEPDELPPGVVWMPSPNPSAQMASLVYGRAMMSEILQRLPDRGLPIYGWSATSEFRCGSERFG